MPTRLILNPSTVTNPTCIYASGVDLYYNDGNSNVIRMTSGGSINAAPAGATGANPSASVGLTATNGSALTYMRSDGAPALSQSIIPTWSALHTFQVFPVTPSSAPTTDYQVANKKYVDDSVSPKQAAASFSNWASFTPTGTWTTNVTYTGKYRRVGDTIEIQARVVCSNAPGEAGTMIISFSGITGSPAIDTAKLLNATQGITPLDGVGGILDAATAIYPCFVLYESTTSVRLVTLDTNAVESIVSKTNPITFGASDEAYINFKAPISGWSF